MDKKNMKDEELEMVAGGSVIDPFCKPLDIKPIHWPPIFHH